MILHFKYYLLEGESLLMGVLGALPPTELAFAPSTCPPIIPPPTLILHPPKLAGKPPTNLPPLLRLLGPGPKGLPPPVNIFKPVLGRLRPALLLLGVTTLLPPSGVSFVDDVTRLEVEEGEYKPVFTGSFLFGLKVSAELLCNTEKPSEKFYSENLDFIE